MKKLLRLTLEYCVDIDESSLDPEEGLSPEFQDDLKRQARLLQAILSDEKTLSSCLWLQVAQEITSCNYGKAKSMDFFGLLLNHDFLNEHGNVVYSRLLKSAIDTLSSEDRAIIRNGLQYGEDASQFYNRVDLAMDAFTTTLEKVAMEEEEVNE